MPNQNISYATNNSITVSQSGIYEINYYINLSLPVATTVTVGVRNNGSVIPSATISRSLSTNANAIYSGNVISS